MSEDSGLWLVDGKVAGNRTRLRVWAAYERAWDRLYAKKCKLEARHRKETEELDKKLKALKQPYTPWVGQTLTGGITRFVDAARREWSRRKKAGET